MGTLTSKRSLYKPTVSPAETGWGDEVNTNFNILDDVIMNADIAESEGFIRKTGVDAYEAIKSNLTASVAPTANEDTADGYAIGSIWIDIVADKAYICLDATLAAAVWTEVTGAGSSLSVEESGVPKVSSATTLNFTGTLNVTDDGGGQATISGVAGAGMGQLSDDTSPSLGGNLDTAGFTILDSIEGAVEFDNAAFFQEATLTDGANISWNLSTQPVAKVTLGGNRTLDNPTNMKAGATYILRALKTAGTETLDYGNAFLWASGITPVMTSGIDILSFYSDGTYMYGAFLGDFK